MFTAISSLRVPAERREALEARFRARGKRVDTHEGFRRVQLLRGRGTDEYLLLVEWDSMEDFKRYAKHEDFHHAHGDLDDAVTPGGLRLFDVVLDSARGE